MKKREFDRLLKEAVLSDAEIQGGLLAAEWIADPIPQASRERFLRLLEKSPRRRPARAEEPETPIEKPARVHRILTYVLTACASAAVTAALLLVVILPFLSKQSVSPSKPADATAAPTDAPTPASTPFVVLPALPEMTADAEQTEAPKESDLETPDGAVDAEALIGTWVAEDGSMLREGADASLVFREDGSATWTVTPRGGEREQTAFRRYTISGNRILFWNDGAQVPILFTDSSGRTDTWDVRYSADDQTIYVTQAFDDRFILRLRPASTDAPHKNGATSPNPTVSSIGGETEHGMPHQGSDGASDFFGNP